MWTPAPPRPQEGRGRRHRRIHQLLRRQQRQTQAHSGAGQEWKCAAQPDSHPEERHGAGKSRPRPIRNSQAAHKSHAAGSPTSRLLRPRSLSRPPIPESSDHHHRRPAVRRPAPIPPLRPNRNLPASAPPPQAGATGQDCVANSPPSVHVNIILHVQHVKLHWRHINEYLPSPNGNRMKMADGVAG